MSKKSKKVIQEEVKLELTPMIDVTFLILIFFMCTLKFKTLEGKLVSYLPTDKGLSAAKADIEFEDAEIILQVPKEDWEKDPLDRRIVFKRNGSNEPLGVCRGLTITKGDEKNPSWNWDPPSTPDNIFNYLKDVRSKSAESKAKINAYARCPHVYVVRVLNLMMDAGFTDISYSGIPKTLIADLQAGKIK